MNDSDNIELVKDKEWSIIDGEACRVSHFTPFASVEKGKIKNARLTTPYACISLECIKLTHEAKGYITHKVDFINLWEAFKVRGINEEEEIIVTWTQKNYKKYYKAFSFVGLPKLIIWICHKGSYEIMNGVDKKPELTGRTWFEAIKPIKEWKPEVMY
jgi:hypothetical protein